MIRNNAHIQDQRLQEGPLDVMHFVHFHSVADGVPAVVAGRNDEGRSSFADLLELHEETLVALFAIATDAVHAAATAAAVVVGAVFFHFTEVLSDLGHDVAGVLFKTVVADVVAGILKRAGFLDLLGRVDLDLAGADGVGIGYVFKASYDKANRSAAGSVRGPGMEKGLEFLAEVKSRYNVPIVTDVHETIEVARAAEVADILQIPAKSLYGSDFR